MKIKITLLVALLSASPLVRAEVAGQTKIDVVITQSGLIEVQQKTVQLSELRELLAKDKSVIVRVVVDSKADFKRVVSVFDTCRDAGVVKIEIVADKKA